VTQRRKGGLPEAPGRALGAPREARWVRRRLQRQLRHGSARSLPAEVAHNDQQRDLSDTETTKTGQLNLWVKVTNFLKTTFVMYAPAHYRDEKARTTVVNTSVGKGGSGLAFLKKACFVAAGFAAKKDGQLRLNRPSNSSCSAQQISGALH
jgi:hypothetical protein